MHSNSFVREASIERCDVLVFPKWYVWQVCLFTVSKSYPFFGGWSVWGEDTIKWPLWMICDSRPSDFFNEIVGSSASESSSCSSLIAALRYCRASRVAMLKKGASTFAEIVALAILHIMPRSSSIAIGFIYIVLNYFKCRCTPSTLASMLSLVVTWRGLVNSRRSLRRDDRINSDWLAREHTH